MSIYSYAGGRLTLLAQVVKAFNPLVPSPSSLSHSLTSVLSVIHTLVHCLCNRVDKTALFPCVLKVMMTVSHCTCDTTHYVNVFMSHAQHDSDMWGDMAPVTCTQHVCNTHPTSCMHARQADPITCAVFLTKILLISDNLLSTFRHHIKLYFCDGKVVVRHVYCAWFTCVDVINVSIMCGPLI